MTVPAHREQGNGRRSRSQAKSQWLGRAKAYAVSLSPEQLALIANWLGTRPSTRTSHD